MKKFDGNILVLEDYINTNTKLLHKCQICNYEWIISPSHLLKSDGCPVCKHQKIVSAKNEHYLITHKRKIKEKFSSNIEVISESYISSNEKLIYHCTVCNNTWEKKPSEILRSLGCPNCVYKLKGINSRLSFDDFIKTINIDSIEVIKETYSSTNNPVNCKCKKCDYQWTVNQASSLRHLKIGCPKCANNLNFSNEEFIKRYKKNFNNNIELLSPYINAITPILCRCKLCGQLSDKLPKHIINGDGCIKCSSIKRGENLKITQEDFINRIKERNPNIRIDGNYCGYNEKILCTCLICNKSWNPIAGNILHSFGCPFCEMSIGEQLIKSYLDSCNIKYDYEHTFTNLKGINGGLLSYDFYLPSFNLLIEYQGQQHKKPIEYFGGKEQFDKQQEHDRRKREYAYNHNIHLLEIWYYDIDKTEKILEQILNNLKSESLTTAG